MCHGSLISICLCLQMFILATGALQDQGPCIPLMDILDGKAHLTCSLLGTQNVEYMNITCSRYQDYLVFSQCKAAGYRPEKPMKKYADRSVRRAKLVVCNRTRNLTIPNDWTDYNCTFEIGNSSSEEQKVEDAKSNSVTVLIMVPAVTVLLIVLTSIILYRKGRKLENWWKNRRSKSQPSPSQVIQPPYVPAPDTDPDDDLHFIATDGNANTATATVDTHDAVPGETSVNSTEDPYPLGITTMDAFLTAGSESANAYDSEAHDSAYCDSDDSAYLDAEACDSAVATLLAAGVTNKLLSKHDSQKQVEMQVFAPNQQVYNPEYC